MNHPVPTSLRSSSGSDWPRMRKVSLTICATYEHSYIDLWVSKYGWFALEYHNDPMTLRGVKYYIHELRPMAIIIIIIIITDHQYNIVILVQISIFFPTFEKFVRPVCHWYNIIPMMDILGDRVQLFFSKEMIFIYHFTVVVVYGKTEYYASV